MPIDQATLDQYIAEVAGDDQELATSLRERLGQNERAATNFLGGFMRSSDYTKKTQGLSRDRQQLEQLQSDYESRLQAADAEKQQIMTQLAESRLSASQAQTLLKNVQTNFGLDDNDIPGIKDLRATERTGQVVDHTPDIDSRLSSFKQEIMREISSSLIPEISSLAAIGPIWTEMDHEHKELFGKRLTKKEMNEILADAKKENRSLEQVWTDRYSVADKRLEYRDGQNKNKWRQEWEDEQAKKNQELALSGIRPESNEFAMQDRQSPVLRKNFSAIEPEQTRTTPLPNQEAAPVNRARGDAERERMSGADRAAAKFMERSRNGQIGQPIQKSA